MAKSVKRTRPQSNKGNLFIFIESILGWVKGVGLASCFLGGLGMMQDPRVFWWSVALIYLGIILIALDLHFETWFRSAKPIWKITANMIILGVVATFSMEFVFVSAPLGVDAVFYNADTDIGTVKAGIPWRPEFSELIVTISNPSEINYEDLELTVKPDEPVAAVGQLSSVADVSFEVAGQNQLSAIDIDNATGNKTEMPLKLVATDVGYKVRCGRLAAKETIQIEMAIAEIRWNPSPANGGVFDKDYILRVNLHGGEKLWYGYTSGDPYVKATTVSFLKVEGKYMASQRKRILSTEIKPVNPVNFIFGK